MPDDVTQLHLPNVHNCIQSALYQISIGNYEMAEAFLRNSQQSLDKAQKLLN